MIPFLREPTRVYALDGSGRLVAEITFPETAPGVYTIDHTFVDASLRGQGVADRLVRAALEQIQKLDMDSLNRSIESLAKIMEPLSRIFG